MPIREGAPLGAPCWIDLLTSDLDRAKDFYGTIFGWTFESAGPEYGGYVTASKDGRPVAGLMGNDPQFRTPDGWTTYLHTADIKATLAAATAAGGAPCSEPMEIKDKGHMATLTDSTGAFFGLWQPNGHNGFEVVNEADAPVYFQLTTRDYGKALDFYREVFGWQTETCRRHRRIPLQHSDLRWRCATRSDGRNAGSRRRCARELVLLPRRRGRRQDRAIGEGERRHRHPRGRGHPVRPACRRGGSHRRGLQPVFAGSVTSDCWAPWPLRRVSSSSR